MQNVADLDRPVTTLLQRAGEGDHDAWEQLTFRFGRLVRAVVRRHRLQEADSRDAEQRTWLRLIECHRAVREPEHLGAWLSTTARRECLSILRTGPTSDRGLIPPQTATSPAACRRSWPGSCGVYARSAAEIRR